MAISYGVGDVLFNVATRWRIGVQFTGGNESMSLFTLSLTEELELAFIGGRSKMESESLDTDPSSILMVALLSSGGCGIEHELGVQEGGVQEGGNGGGGGGGMSSMRWAAAAFCS